jgi:hypothetical protein
MHKPGLFFLLFLSSLVASFILALLIGLFYPNFGIHLFALACLVVLLVLLVGCSLTALFAMITED